MGNRLDGKVCIVTGAGSGMGRACAIEMAAQGGRIVVTDIDEPSANATAQTLADAGGEGSVFVCDLRRPDQIRDLVAFAADRFGGIDVLHNNAAVHKTDLTPHPR